MNVSSIGATQAAYAGGATMSSASPFASALQSLGSALQAGDLTSAQQAFAKLQQAMQSHHGGHHHHHSAQAPASTQPATSSETSATGIDTLA